MASRVSLTLAATTTLVAAVAALIGASPVPARGQEASANPAASLAPAEHQFLGVERCEACHQEPTQAYLDRGVTDFVTLNESQVWLTDIHSRAYELIDPANSSLSQQICDKLQIADIRHAQPCLSCHANWLPGHERPPTYQRGVACESCHGPSQDWDVPHSREDWRAKPVAEKEKLGMHDVRDPIKRGEQCLSCHIGDAASGKVVTHDMYAAGHPPLPGIEIESFARQMPIHWRYLDDKPAFRRRGDFVRESHRQLLGNEATAEQLPEHHHTAAAVVLGGVMALREYADLLGDMAARPDQAWPELAVLDCTACHHELAMPSWRQDADARTSSGRPTIPRWPAALVRLAILHISPERARYDQQLAEFHARLAAVRAAFESTPFGRPAQVRTATTDLSDWLTNELIKPVAAKPFDSRALQRAFGLLTHIGSTEPQDYDSARQLAWAVRTLYCELEPKPGRDQQVRQVLRELSDALRLDLPNHPSDACAPRTPIAPAARELTPLRNGLSQNLLIAASYNPQDFRARMLALRDLLARD